VALITTAGFTPITTLEILDLNLEVVVQQTASIGTGDTWEFYYEYIEESLRVLEITQDSKGTPAKLTIGDRVGTLRRCSRPHQERFQTVDGRLTMGAISDYLEEACSRQSVVEDPGHHSPPRRPSISSCILVTPPTLEPATPRRDDPTRGGLCRPFESGRNDDQLCSSDLDRGRGHRDVQSHLSGTPRLVGIVCGKAVGCGKGGGDRRHLHAGHRQCSSDTRIGGVVLLTFASQMPVSNRR